MISRPAAENYFFNAKYAKRNPFLSNVLLKTLRISFSRCMISRPCFSATSLEKDVAYFFQPLRGLVSQQRLLKRTLRIFFQPLHDLPTRS
jgi:hypothetical protein